MQQLKDVFLGAIPRPVTPKYPQVTLVLQSEVSRALTNGNVKEALQTAKDKIAMTAIKVSIPAILLQMYAEQRYGPTQVTRFDKYTVTMTHPDAMTALLAARNILGLGRFDTWKVNTDAEYHEEARESADQMGRAVPRPIQAA